MRCQTFAAFLLATALPAIASAVNADTQSSGHDSLLIARHDARETDFYDPEHRRQLIARGLTDVEPFPPQLQTRSEIDDSAEVDDDVADVDDDVADADDVADVDDDVADVDDDVAVVDDDVADVGDDVAVVDDDVADVGDDVADAYDSAEADDDVAEVDDDASAAGDDEFAGIDEDNANQADADDNASSEDPANLDRRRVDSVDVAEDEDGESDILRRGVTGEPAFVQPVARRHPRQFRGFA